MLGLIVLFILLSPGFLLTIPAIGGRYFRTNKTSPTSVIVHGIIFGLIVYLVRKYYSSTFFEGFADSTLNAEIAATNDAIDTARNKATTMINEINTKLKDTKIPTDIRNKLKAQLAKITTLSGNLKQFKDEQVKIQGKAIDDRQKFLNNLPKSATLNQRKTATAALENAKKLFNKTKSDIKQRINDLNNALIPIVEMPGKMPIVPNASSSFAMPNVVIPTTMPGKMPIVPNASSSFAMPAPPSALKNIITPKGSSSYAMPIKMEAVNSYGPSVQQQMKNLNVGAISSIPQLPSIPKLF